MPLLYHNNNSISNITSFPQVPSGNPVLLSTATASGSSSISFTSGIDSTYDVYQFEFNSIHPSASGRFTFQCSTNGGSSYGVTATTTFFRAYHDESDTATALEYDGGGDQAQSTSFVNITDILGTDNDLSTSGNLYLFSPSSNTYVKHFISTTNCMQYNPFSIQVNSAGYFNDGANDIDAVQFKMSSGNIDAGTIKMYGIKA